MNNFWETNFKAYLAGESVPLYPETDRGVKTEEVFRQMEAGNEGRPSVFTKTKKTENDFVAVRAKMSHRKQAFQKPDGL